MRRSGTTCSPTAERVSQRRGVKLRWPCEQPLKFVVMACILIVDDEASVRVALRQKLEEMGHCVKDASDGRKALLIVEEHEPDVALVDIIMPEMDGLERIKEFKRKHYGFPIIAMPSHGMRKRAWYSDVAKMFGADEVLEKPFTPKEVETIVSRIIEQEA